MILVIVVVGGIFLLFARSYSKSEIASICCALFLGVAFPFLYIYLPLQVVLIIIFLVAVLFAIALVRFTEISSFLKMSEVSISRAGILKRPFLSAFLLKFGASGKEKVELPVSAPLIAEGEERDGFLSEESLDVGVGQKEEKTSLTEEGTGFEQFKILDGVYFDGSGEKPAAAPENRAPVEPENVGSFLSAVETIGKEEKAFLTDTASGVEDERAPDLTRAEEGKPAEETALPGGSSEVETVEEEALPVGVDIPEEKSEEVVACEEEELNASAEASPEEAFLTDEEAAEDEVIVLGEAPLGGFDLASIVIEEGAEVRTENAEREVPPPEEENVAVREQNSLVFSSIDERKKEVPGGGDLPAAVPDSNSQGKNTVVESEVDATMEVSLTVEDGDFPDETAAPDEATTEADIDADQAGGTCEPAEDIQVSSFESYSLEVEESVLEDWSGELEDAGLPSGTPLQELKGSIDKLVREGIEAKLAGNYDRAVEAFIYALECSKEKKLSCLLTMELSNLLKERGDYRKSAVVLLNYMQRFSGELDGREKRELLGAVKYQEILNELLERHNMPATKPVDLPEFIIVGADKNFLKWQQETFGSKAKA